MHRAVPLQRTAGPDRPCPHALRERWRMATMAAGWPFPSDWGVPAVDAVCEAATEGRDPAHALAWLGRARAETGAGLAETLDDLAVLHAVLRATPAPGTPPETPPGAPPGVDGPSARLYWCDGPSTQGRSGGVPGRLVRVTALGWADVASGEIGSTQVVDQLTGLVTTGYLRTRLGEIYRRAESTGRTVGGRHVLVLVTVDLSRTSGWTRLMPMLLVAEAMRTVFDGGETLAMIGPSVAVALCRRTDELPMSTRRLRRLATELLAADPAAARAAPVRIWLERLPSSYPSACDLISCLGR